MSGWLVVAATTTSRAGSEVSYDGVALVVSIAAGFVSLTALIVPYFRRPKLSLLSDSRREHSQVEGDGLPYLRALVRNAKWKRSAKHARVVHDGHRPSGAKGRVRMGSPFLSWPSTFGQDSSFYADVVFADSERPVGIGRFVRVKLDKDGRLVREERYRQTFSGRVEPVDAPPVRHHPDDHSANWYLHLEIGDWSISNERDWLEPGSWEIRLLIGADDGDARAYLVTLSWRGDEPDAQAVLASALGSLRIERD